MPQRRRATASSRADLDALLADWGEPRYRADQVWDALCVSSRARRRHRAASCVPRPTRRRAPPRPRPAHRADRRRRHDDRSGCGRARATSAQIETVLMRYPERATVCVSSQAGCAMGCTFCATGQAGFERHLAAGEIVEQVLRAAQASPQRVSNVVFMGMGEPLANYDNTWAAVERIHDDLGLSARRITISTVGRGSGNPTPRRRSTAGHSRGVAARGDRRRARAARAAQPALSDRRRPRRRRRVRGIQGPAGHLRVRLHRGGERHPRAGRGARAPPGRVPRCRRRAREPDPAQPDRRIRRPRARRTVAPGVRRPAPGPRCDGDGTAQPGHRHRRGLRAAAVTRGDTSGAGAIGHNEDREPVEVGQSVPAADPLHGDDPLLRRRRVRPALRRGSPPRSASSSSAASAPAASASPTRRSGAMRSR